MKKNILKQLFIVLLCTFAVNNFMFAQDTPGFWSAENSFNIKNVFELYDERGFSKNMETALDGNLMVNPVNGNLGYAYKINEFTVSDRKITVDMNYCNAISFTSYTAYKYSTRDNWGNPEFWEWFDGLYGEAQIIPTSGTDRNYWEQFKQNRPAWIMSVNNFAVQVFGGANFYTCNPFIQKESVCSTAAPLTDEHVVWTIDGYEVCNNMRNLFWTDGSSNGGVSQDHDNIRILRGDGSILELTNSYPMDPNNNIYNSSVNISRVSGIYYENGVNTKGYAILEFDNSRRPNCSNDQFSEVPDRILKYYPGDGLEYIFYEDIAPWGIPNLVNHPYFPLPSEAEYIRGLRYWSIGNWLPADNNGYPVSTYNKYAYTSPTIFYLKEIRTQGSNSLCKIKYKNENEYLYSCVKDKYTGGRTNFEGIYLNENEDLGIKMENYEPKWSSDDKKNVVSISGLGKKTFIHLNAKYCNVSGEKLSIPENVGMLKYIIDPRNLTNSNSKVRHSIFNSSNLFCSWLDYVVGIEETDPTAKPNEVNRKTYKKIDFDYQEYERSYYFATTQERFPVPALSYCCSEARLNLKNYRLTRIKKDDGTLLDISYKKRANNDMDINIPSSVFSGSVPIFMVDYVKINNVIDKIETKKGSTLLKSEYYENYRFYFPDPPPPASPIIVLKQGPEGCNLIITDVINSTSKTINYFYCKNIFTPPQYNSKFNPQLVHTQLNKVVEDDGCFETTTTTNGEFVAPVNGIQPNIGTSEQNLQ